MSTKHNTGRKWTVVRDGLNLSGAGIYVISPFDNYDENGKTVYKIGMTTDIRNRINHYNSYFKTGSYIILFLYNVPVAKTLRSDVSKKDKESSTYKKIEKFVVNKVLSFKGTIQLKSTVNTRKSDPETGDGGPTEWIYCDYIDVHNAINDAQDEFGGKILMNTHHPMTQ